MVFVLLRILYIIYFIGVVVCIYHAVSRVIFPVDRRPLKARMESALRVIAVGAIWPLALMSAGGRARFMAIIENL